jgi:hypothetical protein
MSSVLPLAVSSAVDVQVRVVVPLHVSESSLLELAVCSHVDVDARVLAHLRFLMSLELRFVSISVDHAVSVSGKKCVQPPKVVESSELR